MSPCADCCCVGSFAKMDNQRFTHIFHLSAFEHSTKMVNLLASFLNFSHRKSQCAQAFFEERNFFFFVCSCACSIAFGKRELWFQFFSVVAAAAGVCFWMNGTSGLFTRSLCPRRGCVLFLTIVSEWPCDSLVVLMMLFVSTPRQHLHHHLCDE